METARAINSTEHGLARSGFMLPRSQSGGCLDTDTLKFARAHFLSDVCKTSLTAYSSSVALVLELRFCSSVI